MFVRLPLLYFWTAASIIPWSESQIRLSSKDITATLLRIAENKSNKVVIRVTQKALFLKINWIEYQGVIYFDQMLS